MDVPPRRLPVYLVVDTSAAMAGDPIEEVRQCIKELLSKLRQDPTALETAYVSIITFGSTAEQVCPLTELATFQEPDLIPDGDALLGDALRLLVKCIYREVRKPSANDKGDFEPLIFIITCCQPTGSWETVAQEVREGQIGKIIGCMAGSGADPAVLKRITDVVINLDTPHGGNLGDYFRWVSASVTATPHSAARLETDANEPQECVAFITNVLSKPIYLQTAEGLIAVAEEGEALPLRREIRIKKLFGDAVIEIPVLQGSEVVSTIQVTDIPPEAGEGSLIALSVEITQENEMRATVRVYTWTGSLVNETSVKIDFPQQLLPELAELTAKFGELRDTLEQELMLSDDPEHRMLLAGPANKLVKKAQKLFEEQDPAPNEIVPVLRELEKIAIPPPDDMDPPRWHFRALLDRGRELLSTSTNDPNVQSLHSILNRLENEGNQAFTTKNRRKWATVNENIERTFSKIQKVTMGGTRNEDIQAAPAPVPLPSTPLMKDYFHEQVFGLRNSLQAAKANVTARADYATVWKARYDDVESSLDDMDKRIEKVPDDANPRKALAQMQLAMQAEPRIRRQIDVIRRNVAVEAVEPRLPDSPVRQSRPELPGGRVDRVHFSVTSPPVMMPGNNYVIDIWAHLERQRQAVIQRAREEAEGGEIRIKSKGPVKLARGTVLMVRLRVPNATVDPPEDTILWEGEVGNATFAVSVSQEVRYGSYPGVATIYVGGLQVARLDFTVQIGREPSKAEALPVREKHYRAAFASYADVDRSAVLGRIQGMQKVAPDLDVFLAAAQLRSGERWQERLRQEILHRDVMYLFWSESAKQSQWVDWEWRCAYTERGIDFIDPCPLAPPDVVPPPQELADQLHFNDWVLAYMKPA